MAAESQYDFIVVGAGSAGCVVAERLSADPGVQVCLIEAGPSDKGLLARLLTIVPVGVLNLISNPRYNWMYEYEPEPRLGARRIGCPRGRLLGGSSSINGMVYIRGHRLDYDHWARLGAKGWSYEELLPFFKKSERFHGPASSFHGDRGEIDVSDPQDPHPINEAFFAAAEGLQYRRNDDFNGAEQDGIGYYHLTQRRGERMSTARAFLRKGEARPNLTVLPGALTERVIVANRRATGVRIRRDGETSDLGARREVIVCGGAINSPQVLMLSGIGPPDELRRHGIAVEHALPGVGENLQDHVDIMACWKSADETLYGLSRGALPWLLLAPFRYAFQRKGALTTNAVESGLFLRSTPGLQQPDLQLGFGPALLNQGHGVPKGHGYTMHVSLLRPRSRGRIRLASARPDQAPKLHSHFLDDPADAATLLAGLKRTRQILAEPAFAKYGGVEILPGPDVRGDPDLLKFIHENVQTVFHPAGSCKMGVDAMAVVDPELKVRGIGGLRVIDASVMPALVSGNTNAPTIMIAEKGSEMIRRAWAA